MSSYLDKLFGLGDKDILLTGASSGIGEHWAWTLARANVRSLALCARRTDRLEKLAAEIKKEFPNIKVCAVPMDVSWDSKQIAKALEQAETALGGVTFNVIVNNAGVGPSAAVLNETQEQLDNTMRINVRGPFLLSMEAAKRMIAKQMTGSIINVASIYGLRVGFNNAVYATSKAALLHMTKAMAIELLGKGIRVNAIAPGYYRSEMTAEFYDSAPGKKFLQTKIPSKRLGLVHELDGALLLLASEASTNMTGSVVVVDGGHSTSSL